MAESKVRPDMTVFLPLIIILAFFSAFLLWLSYGIGGLLALTGGVLEFCQSLFEGCVRLFPMVEVGLLWAGSALILGGVIYGIIKSIGRLVRAGRALKRLPLKESGAIVLIDDDAKAAFTHGLLRPKIYISRGLINSLDSAELKGVFLHELHHRRRMHPLKFFLTGVIRDSFFYIPIIKHMASYALLKKEHEADIKASTSIKDPLKLAGALIKAASPGKTPSYAHASIRGAGQSGVEARIKSLINGDRLKYGLPPLKTLAASLASGAFLVMTLALPLNAGLNGAKHDKSCSTDRCAIHIDKLGKDCKIHCEASTQKHHAHHNP